VHLLRHGDSIRIETAFGIGGRERNWSNSTCSFPGNFHNKICWIKSVQFVSRHLKSNEYFVHNLSATGTFWTRALHPGREYEEQLLRSHLR